MDAPLAAVAETHASVVFFVGERAYKVKKPVSFGFLDFSTREKREAVCRREVALNRRLAPDVYLGVSDVLGFDGAPCEHVIVMRRMPVDRRLSTLVRQRTVTTDDIAGIARVLATFHASANGGDRIATSATVDAVRANWLQSFEQMRPFVGTVLSADDSDVVERLALRYLDGRLPLFERRIAEGRIRDGHGDLLADDIFLLDDGPRILDCIEFDDKLRFGDVLNDVSFLAMDLEYLGATELAHHLLDRWGELTAETHPASLADHYVAYRAHVRAKVACLRSEQGDRDAATDAAAHLALARARLERARVTCVVVGGLPGSGKSTLAEGIARTRGWTVLRSDVIRKELAGMPADTPAGGGFGRGLYDAASVRAVYDEMLRRARRALELGESVVLDASWSAAARRAQAEQCAAETHADLLELVCVVPSHVSAYRLTSRSRSHGSDATPAIAEAMAERAAPWPTAHELDTDRPEADVLRDALSLLERAGGR